MKANIYKGSKQIELQEIELPQCGDNDVILRNLFAGIRIIRSTRNIFWLTL